MKKSFLFLLRIVIVMLLFLPVIFPFVEETHRVQQKEEVTVFFPQGEALSFEMRSELKTMGDSFFAAPTDLNYVWYGAKDTLPAQDYDDLLEKIKAVQGNMIVISRAALFGEVAERFQTSLKQTRAFTEKRLYFLPLTHLKKEKETKSYLVLSDVFIPKISFVGEENIASVSVVGRALAKSQLRIEVAVHTGSSFLNSKSFDFVVPDSGLVREVFDIPIHFVNTGAQVVTATLNTSLSSSPLNSASTVVNVVHAKSTLLHLAVGPNWSLRNLRQKLKFWPNLDLLSFYIMRDRTSDQSIPPNQLSLIEFPSDRLFGSELPNFHGVVAQNFPFDFYLGMKEAQNLAKYVREGGRLVVQGGPLSFLSNSLFLRELSPCENRPQWDTENLYHWRAQQGGVAFGEGTLQKSLGNLFSRATFVGCQPKKNALVLASTQEGNHPVLISMSVGKGIVLAFLASDWMTTYSSLPLNTAIEKYARMQVADSSETVFQWMVAFLQRRQDSGVRAPDFAGPRLYANDVFTLVKSRGILQLGQAVRIENTRGATVDAETKILPQLGAEALGLAQPLANLTSTPVASADTEPRPQWENLSLFSPAAQNQEGFKKFLEWPLFTGTAKLWETQANPFLFEGAVRLSARGEPAGDAAGSRGVANAQKRPLLEVYPWLLALALALLLVEQFISRLLWR